MADFVSHGTAITWPVGLNVHTPVISSLFGGDLLQRKRAIGIRQTTKSSLKAHLLDGSGNPVDLIYYGFTTSTTATELIVAKVREASLVDSTVYSAYATVVDATTGLIEFDIPEGARDVAGVYLAEVGVFDTSSNLLFTNEYYIYVEPSAWSATQYLGPPTLDEIRLSIRDSDANENELLGQLDFDVAEIASAVTRTVRYWNVAPPVLRVAIYSTRTFPFRDIWLEGAQLNLFAMAEEGYRRNFLKAAAGGTVTDDRNRHREYNVAYREHLARFNDSITREKVSINLSQCFGVLGNPH